jgi:hypothetical protein
MSTVSKPTRVAKDSLIAVVLAAAKIGATARVGWDPEADARAARSPRFAVLLRKEGADGPTVGELVVHPCGSVEADGSDLAEEVDRVADETILIVEGKAF